MNKDWREMHGKVIRDFLSDLNKKTNGFVLKGGTALAQCYKLNRFSEDIDLDATKENIIHHVKNFAQKNGYDYRIAKDTVTVKRCFINYGNDEKPLKIEVSYRNRNIPDCDITEINGIAVYTIDKLAQMKSNAYNARDKIRDLYDLAFIVNSYFDKLQETTISFIADALSYKGIEQFDYIVETQHDELINVDKLAESFLEMHEKLGLICDPLEVEITKSYKKNENDNKDSKNYNIKKEDTQLQPRVR